MKQIRLATLLLAASLSLGLTSCAQKKNFETMTYQEQLEAVKKDGTAIRLIKNPTEEQKLEAVKQNGSSLQYIKEQNEVMQLEAVKNNKEVARYLINPSEAVQLAAVKQKSDSIHYFQNASEAVQLEAIQQSHTNIYLINNPSNAVQLEVMKKDGKFISKFSNPSDEVKNEANKNLVNQRYISGKAKNFTMSDKNIHLTIDNDTFFFIQNTSKQFINIKAMSFYYGNSVTPVESFTLAPDSKVQIRFPKDVLEINPYADTANFGFAIKYESNNKIFDLYNTKQYRLVDLYLQKN